MIIIAFFGPYITDYFEGCTVINNSSVSDVAILRYQYVRTLRCYPFFGCPETRCLGSMLRSRYSYSYTLFYLLPSKPLCGVGQGSVYSWCPLRQTNPRHTGTPPGLLYQEWYHLWPEKKGNRKQIGNQTLKNR